MLKERLALSSLCVDLVNADLLVPGRDREVVGDWREREVGNAVFWWVVEGDVFAEIAQGIGRARSAWSRSKESCHRFVKLSSALNFSRGACVRVVSRI